MSHFAQIDENGIVQRVIVAEQEVIDSGLFGNPATWIQTSYNTRAGVHTQGGRPLRKNFAGVGYKYDAQRDAFIPPKPDAFPSFVLDEAKGVWKPPIPRPNNNTNKPFVWGWNEDEQKWEQVDFKNTRNGYYI